MALDVVLASATGSVDMHVQVVTADEGVTSGSAGSPG